MMKKIVISLVSAALIFGSAGAVSAQSMKPTAVRENTDQAKTERLAAIKAKAEAEIDRRIAALNKLITIIQGLKRLSDTQKSNFIAMANSQITSLSALKTKIEADTTIEALRADQQSIFNQYRIYMLFMPQLRIMTAADRMAETADLMSQVSVKLQARINGDASLTALLNDANTKISEAKTLYTSAETDVAGLTPDNGDAGKMNSNKEALQDARVDLQKGATDLKAARDDFQKIITSLKATTSKP